MSKSKFMSKLLKEEGVVQFGNSNPLANCLRSPSPSVNWAFANAGHGLPFGYSCVLYGPPKGGKSILCNSWIGQLHKDDPEALALSFNTELRGEIQSNEDQLRLWGIDPDRFRVLNRNTPEGVFDFIEKDIAAACQEGEKIKLIVIDSLTGIQGRRSMNADTVMTQQIGDHALTIQTGLQRILPVIRKYNIALIMTAHVRAELDQAEQMRGNTVKMAASWATKHMAEYFVFVAPNKSKDGRTTLTGEEFVNEQGPTDFMGKSDKTGHKIRLTVKENSLGIAGRTAEFTLDYAKGIVNQHEEIFELALAHGVITKPNNVMYQIGESQYRGLAAVLTAIRDDQRIQETLLKAVFEKTGGA